MIKNTKVGGTDWGDGNVLYAVDQNDTFDAVVNITESDQTGGSITSSTTETKIGEVIFNANTTINGILIMVSGKAKGTTAGSTTSTIKLYSGTNATFGSNTLRKTITRTTKNDHGLEENGWTIFYVLTSEETWTGNVYIHITGTNSNSSANNYVTCESVVIIGIGGAN